MMTSNRAQSLSESVTLKLNALAVKMQSEGKKVYNLTAGQLPFRPPKALVEGIRGELDFLSSFQYSPVAGEPKLVEKFMSYFQSSRGVSLDSLDTQMKCIVGNGGKHIISNFFASVINEGDEVILISPYWVSYPEMINLYGGVVKNVDSSIYNEFEPDIGDIENAISSKTKVIVINSPNNPTGTHYSDNWMKDFAKMIAKYEDILIISDEIYFELSYFDPKPTYFYQHDHSLLERTIVMDGVSKSLASTGLRIGYAIGNSDIIKAMNKIQSHTTSGANSLVQKSLLKYDFDNIDEYLKPIKSHLRDNSQIIKDLFRVKKLSKSWYQTVSAFYFFVDFSQAPIIEKYRNSEDDKTDYSTQVCQDLLENSGLALVPGEAFGSPNCARLSLVNPKEAFTEAIELLTDAMIG